MKRKILIVEDDTDVARIVEEGLRKSGFDVATAGSAEDALDMAEKERFDLFIIDIILPGKDGKAFLSDLRKMERYKTAPAIFLTALDDEVEKVIGLELGADDYVTKPFSVRELVARVKSIFRRIEMDTEGVNRRPKKIYAKDLEIDTEKYEVKVKGKKVNLTPLEFDLLCFLAENEGKVFSREVLLDRLWGYDYFIDTRTVDVHIRRLRTKIEEDPSKPKYILTVRGKGYKFSDPGKEG